MPSLSRHASDLLGLVETWEVTRYSLAYIGEA